MFFFITFGCQIKLNKNMNLLQYIPLLIIVLTVISSVKGFNDMAFFDRLKFNIGAILGKDRQWDRLITSAFLHGDWLHLIFNMMTLYFFSDVIIYYFGVWQYMTIYFLSIIGGGLLSLLVHRRDYYYSAIGASGGVVGILFAAIAAEPNIGINIMFIPIDIPGWIFGIIYLLFSIYGMRNSVGNIGHDAHMGGAAVGLLLAVLLDHSLLATNGLYIAIMVVPLIILGYMVWKQK